MKIWIYRLALASLAVALVAIVLLSSYMAGWKTGGPKAGAASELFTPSSAQTQPRRSISPEGNGRRSEHSSLAALDIQESGLTNALQQAWNRLRFSSDPDLAAAELWHLLEKLEPGQFSAAFDLACAIPGRDSRRTAIYMVLRHWAEIDPTAALDASANKFKKWERFDYTNPILIQVARSDHALAYQAYRKHIAHLDGPSYDSAVYPLDPIFSEWAQKDFGAAWSQFESLNPREKKYALRGMARLLEQDSPSAELLLDALNQSGDPALLEFVRTSVVQRLARRGEIEAAELWLDQQGLPGETRRSLENEMAGRWAHENPREAAEWLLARSGAGDNGARLRQVVDLWADWESAACAEWLNRQISQGRNLDGAVDVFARSVAPKDPANALSWASTISDPAVRRRSASYLGELFRRRHLPDAAQLIERSPLPPSDKQAALEKLAR